MMLLLLIEVGLAQESKYLGFGALQNTVYEDVSDGYEEIGWIPYNGFGLFQYDDFAGPLYALQGWYLGASNWHDEDGTLWPIKLTGDGQWSGDNKFTVMPLEDEAGNTIKRYVRYMPPKVTVDGTVVSDPFPFDVADEVAPERIPGSAYAMIELRARTDMGMTLHYRVLQWGHDKHDNYLIYEWTFINTGNTDLDDEVELPGQTVTDLYFSHNDRPAVWYTWMSSYGETYGLPGGDSLRIFYSYPPTSKTSNYDMFGSPEYPGTGFLRYPVSAGMAVLHADRSGTDKTDWPAQPHVWGMLNCDLTPFLYAPNKMSDTDILLNYESMVNGFKDWDLFPLPEAENQWPGGHKSQRFDELGYDDVTDYPITYPTNMSYMAMGPYDIAFGDSVTFILALVSGNLSPRKAMEIGADWEAGNATFPGEIDLPAQFDALAADDNDRAKDAWVYSSVDSLFMHTANAQWAAQNNYQVPIPPAAPSVEVISSPDKITVGWDGTESEKPSDFAGYRVYRALGSPDPQFSEGEMLGEWQLVFECGEGTSNDLTYGYDDVNAERGQAYYYYVTAFDDGSDLSPDFGRPSGGVSLESGKYMNRTTVPAFLTREAGSLDAARVVPNPYNISAAERQYTGEPDKIMFLNIPGNCTISIYSESGDLVKRLEHPDGSGDQSWGFLNNEHSTTTAGQRVVSGLYIAHIVDNDTGESKNLKFVVIR